MSAPRPTSRALVPSRSATSTRRSELELFGEPITSIASQRAGDRLDRRLPVRGRVADVLAARPLDARGSGGARMATISAVSSTDSVVWVRKARLSGSAGAIALGVRGGLDQGHPPFRHLAERADHLGMAGMADEQDVAAVLDQPLGLAVDLGDERAGGVEIVEAALLPPWPAPPWARRGRRRPPARRPAPRRARARTPRPWPSGCRRRTCCGRSRGGHRPARRSARAPARRCGWRGRRRRRSRAARRSAG